MSVKFDPDKRKGVKDQLQIKEIPCFSRDPEKYVRGRPIFKQGAIVGALLFTDCLSYFATAILAAGTRIYLGKIFPNLFPSPVSMGNLFTQWWIPAVYLGFIANGRLYDKRLPFWDEPKELLKALWIATIMIFAIVSLGRLQSTVSRMFILLLFLYGSFSFFTFRLIGKRVLSWVGLWKENVLIFGAGQAGVEIARGLSKEKHQGYSVVGFLDDDPEKQGKTIEIEGKRLSVLGKIKQFGGIAAIRNVNTVVIAMPSLSAARLAQITNTVQRHFKSVFLIPEIRGTTLLNSELYHLFMQQLYMIHINNNLRSTHNRFLKAMFDIVVCLLLLPFLMVMIGAICVLIRLDSPGAVFYLQERVGRGGKPIRVWKFRTMFIDAKDRLDVFLEQDERARVEWESNYKLKNDPRVTRVGRILRSTSLDELPQIFNVFRGEMSLVGPRPVLQEELDRHYKEYARYYYLVRPGISGLWQVSGRSNTTYDYRVWLDSWYVMNWTLWLDVVIVFKTISTVFRREGAY